MQQQTQTAKGMSYTCNIQNYVNIKNSIQNEIKGNKNKINRNNPE